MVLVQKTSLTLSDEISKLVESVKTDEGITRLDEVNSFGFIDPRWDDQYDSVTDEVRGIH